MIKPISSYGALLLSAVLLAAACSSSAPAPPASSPAGAEAATDAAIPDGGAPDPDASKDDVGLPEASDEDAPETCTPPASSPATGPGGYLMDGWTWTRHGVVLEDSSVASQDGYIAPAAVVVGDSLHLWVTRKHGTVHRILHSVSTDGTTFAPPVETTGLEGQDIIAYPSVLYDGSQFLMWYGSGVIDHARSDDGLSWTMVATGVLKPGETGAFDSLSLLYPNVVARQAGYVMFYTGFDGQAFGIGRAESLDGMTWTRAPSGPVLSRGGASEFDNHAVAQPNAVAFGERVLLWYGGYDTSVANPGPYRVGLAEAPDGVAFTRKGVTLDLEASGPEAWSTRDPAVVRWKGQWWMAYCAMGDDGRYRIAVASSETCAGN